MSWHRVISNIPQARFLWKRNWIKLASAALQVGQTCAGCICSESIVGFRSFLLCEATAPRPPSTAIITLFLGHYSKQFFMEYHEWRAVPWFMELLVTRGHHIPRIGCIGRSPRWEENHAGQAEWVILFGLHHFLLNCFRLCLGLCLGNYLPFFLFLPPLLFLLLPCWLWPWSALALFCHGQWRHPHPAVSCLDGTARPSFLGICGNPKNLVVVHFANVLWISANAQEADIKQAYRSFLHCFFRCEAVGTFLSWKRNVWTPLPCSCPVRNLLILMNYKSQCIIVV